MLTIGEFSRICFVTKKTLRHYDEIGLLRPEHTAENGYRYYTVEQLRTMRLISRLKKYGFSLPEVAAVLANPDEELLADKLLEKRMQMKAEMENIRHILVQLDGDVEKLKRRIDIMEKNITVKTVELPAEKIYGIRKMMDVKYFSERIGQLFHEVEQKKLQPMGPPMAFYHDEAFNPAHTDIEVAVAVAADVEGVREYPGGLHCYATLHGPYVPEDFTATYTGLVKWIEDNGYRVTGAPFDKYVRGGDNVPPAEYVTEIYFPIAKYSQRI